MKPIKLLTLAELESLTSEMIETVKYVNKEMQKINRNISPVQIQISSAATFNIDIEALDEIKEVVIRSHIRDLTR